MCFISMKVLQNYCLQLPLHKLDSSLSCCRCFYYEGAVEPLPALLFDVALHLGSVLLLLYLLLYFSWFYSTVFLVLVIFLTILFLLLGLLSTTVTATDHSRFTCAHSHPGLLSVFHFKLLVETTDHSWLDITYTLYNCAYNSILT